MPQAAACPKRSVPQRAVAPRRNDRAQAPSCTPSNRPHLGHVRRGRTLAPATPGGRQHAPGLKRSQQSPGWLGLWRSMPQGAACPRAQHAPGAACPSEPLHHDGTTVLRRRPARHRTAHTWGMSAGGGHWPQPPRAGGSMPRAGSVPQAQRAPASRCTTTERPCSGTVLRHRTAHTWGMSAGGGHWPQPPRAGGSMPQAQACPRREGVLQQSPGWLGLTGAACPRGGSVPQRAVAPRRNDRAQAPSCAIEPPTPGACPPGRTLAPATPGGEACPGRSVPQAQRAPASRCTTTERPCSGAVLRHRTAHTWGMSAGGGHWPQPPRAGAACPRAQRAPGVKRSQQSPGWLGLWRQHAPEQPGVPQRAVAPRRNDRARRRPDAIEPPTPGACPPGADIGPSHPGRAQHAPGAACPRREALPAKPGVAGAMAQHAPGAACPRRSVPQRAVAPRRNDRAQAPSCAIEPPTPGACPPGADIGPSHPGRAQHAPGERAPGLKRSQQSPGWLGLWRQHAPGGSVPQRAVAPPLPTSTALLPPAVPTPCTAPPAPRGGARRARVVFT